MFLISGGSSGSLSATGGSSVVGGSLSATSVVRGGSSVVGGGTSVSQGCHLEVAKVLNWVQLPKMIFTS